MNRSAAILLIVTLACSVSFVPFKTVKAATELPYTSFSADYTMYFADNAYTVWQTPTNFMTQIINYLDEGFSYLTLSFTFEGLGEYGSTLDYTKMDNLLDLLESYGIDKIIFAVYPSYYQASAVKPIGNSTWAGWLQTLVTYYKDDDRVYGLQPFGEPQDGYIQSGLSSLEAMQWIANLCLTLHGIDSDLIIFYPYFGECYGEYETTQQLYTDLASLGIDDYSWVYMDVVHPYYFENVWDMGLTPTQKAQWYDIRYMDPAKTYLNPDRLCCRETFYWQGLTPSLQLEFTTAIINEFVENNLGFTLAFAVPYLTWYPSSQYHTAIANSNYADAGPSPTPTPAPTATPTPTPAASPTPYPNPGYGPTYEQQRAPNIPMFEGVLAQGSGFNIYADTLYSGLAFQSALVNKTFYIEVLSGTWNGTSASLTLTDKYGELAFYSNDEAEVQIYQTSEHSARISYEGFTLTTLYQGYSYNATIPTDTDCYIRWSYYTETILEENWTIFFGIFGFALLLAGLVTLAYGFRKYPLVTWDKKQTLLDNNILIFSIPAVFIGFGLIFMWLVTSA